jgi:hypothetical protein
MPAIGGLSYRRQSLHRRNSVSGEFSRLCLCAKIPVSQETETRSMETRFDALPWREAKDAPLARPFGRQIGEAGHTHAVGQPALPLHLSVPFTTQHGAGPAASEMSSLSQRRPRASDAINVARFSERMRRACSGGVPSGTRISLRRR